MQCQVGVGSDAGFHLETESGQTCSEPAHAATAYYELTIKTGDGRTYTTKANFAPTLGEKWPPPAASLPTD